MATRRLLIAGRVQGVGFRAWMEREALLDGDTASVEELLRRCRRGPRGAAVSEITEELAEPWPEPGFYRRPMA